MKTEIDFSKWKPEQFARLVADMKAARMDPLTALDVEMADLDGHVAALRNQIPEAGAWRN